MPLVYVAIPPGAPPLADVHVDFTDDVVLSKFAHEYIVPTKCRDCM